jgi:hypothetical protein
MSPLTGEGKSGSWTRIASAAEYQCKDREGAIFFDPPYVNYEDIYAQGSAVVAHYVRRWAIARAKTHPKLRIALCGLEGEHEMPPD